MIAWCPRGGRTKGGIWQRGPWDRGDLPTWRLNLPSVVHRYYSVEILIGRLEVLKKIPAGIEPDDVRSPRLAAASPSTRRAHTADRARGSLLRPSATSEFA